MFVELKVPSRKSMNAHDILDHRVYPQAENKENMFSCPQSSSYASSKTIRDRTLSKENPHRWHTKKIKSKNFSECVYVSLRVSPSIITSAMGRLYHPGL